MADFPFNYDDLPNKSSIDAYVKDARPLGDFLEAVVCNDLRGACERADSKNLRMIPVYVAYLYNECPGGCWGSKERYEAWLSGGV